MVGLWLGPALAQTSGQQPVDLSPERQQAVQQQAPSQEVPQSAPQEAAALEAQQPAHPKSGFRPGFIDAFSRWIGRATTSVQTGFEKATGAVSGLGGNATKAVSDAAGTATGAAKAAKEAAQGALDSMSRLPNTGLVRGHERCAVAPNGGPDCVAAANTLCRTNGFSSGRIVDTQSAQDCPAQVWLRGNQPPAAGECHSATYVVRAVCQ